MTIITILANWNPFFYELAEALEHQGASVIRLGQDQRYFSEQNRQNEIDFARNLVGQGWSSLLIMDGAWSLVQNDSADDDSSEDYGVNKRFLRWAYQDLQRHLYRDRSHIFYSEQATVRKLKEMVDHDYYPIIMMSRLSNHGPLLGYKDWKKSRDQNEITSVLKDAGLVQGEDFVIITEGMLTCYDEMSAQNVRLRSNILASPDWDELKENLPEGKVPILFLDHHLLTYPDSDQVVNTLRLPRSKTHICLACSCCQGIIYPRAVGDYTHAWQKFDAAGFEIYSPFASPEIRTNLIKAIAGKYLKDAAKLQARPTAKDTHVL